MEFSKLSIAQLSWCLSSAICVTSMFPEADVCIKRSVVLVPYPSCQHFNLFKSSMAQLSRRPVTSEKWDSSSRVSICSFAVAELTFIQPMYNTSMEVTSSNSPSKRGVCVKRNKTRNRVIGRFSISELSECVTSPAVDLRALSMMQVWS